jgi:ribosomal protein S18 acetylase RimI-like enzyme
MTRVRILVRNQLTSREAGAVLGDDDSFRQLFMTYFDMLLRPAEPEDAIAVARVHVRSWQTAYRTLLPDDYLDQLRPEDRAQQYDFASPDPLKPRTIVAAEEGLIYGFVTTAPSRDPDLPDHGELCALYVHPEQWGRGIGAALVSAARASLSERGFRNAFLWVLEGNVRAERFYRIDQWAPDGRRRTDSVWGITVNEVRYQRGL